MESIVITVSGEELEQVNVELTKEEVCAIYLQRKEQVRKIAELEKKLADAETVHKYTKGKLDAASEELDQANTLLTALGIQEKTDHEEIYYRKNLQVATRIALYIAKK